MEQASSGKHGLRVSLVDPSLFTLPYDLALKAGLRAAGMQVSLHGRRLRPYETAASAREVETDFYHVAESAPVSLLPTFLRNNVKGIDHAWSILRLLRTLRREKPDVIHFQWLALPALDRLVLGAFRRVAPLVLTMHDTRPFNGDPMSKLQRDGLDRCLPIFDRLIVHTSQGRRRLQAQGLPPEKIVNVPHGLLATVRDDQPEPADGPLTFVLFGNIKPYKGIDVMIEAFARLPQALQSRAIIRVIGKPHVNIRPLKALADRLGVAGRVVIEPRFVPNEEVNAIFGPATVAVFPYLEIEASGVLSIALARGRPVIASALGNFSDILVDGVHGHLVAPNDPAALSAALSHCLSDRRFVATCASNALSLTRDVPDWPTIGRMTAGVYRAAGA